MKQQTFLNLVLTAVLTAVEAIAISAVSAFASAGNKTRIGTLQ